MRTFRTFRNHVSAYHAHETSPSNVTCSLRSEEENSISLSSGDEDDGNQSEQVDEPVPSATVGSLLEAAALVLLKLKEGHKLTQSALQGVIESSTMLWQQHLEEIKSSVQQAMLAGGLNPTSIEGFDDIFSPDGKHGRPFAGLETCHQQMAYYKKHFQLIVS